MALFTPSESPAVVVKEIDLTSGVPNVQSSTGAFVGNFADTSGEFDVLTLTPSATFLCQSLQIRFVAPSAGVFEINDMTIEYRTIRNKKVT